MNTVLCPFSEGEHAGQVSRQDKALGLWCVCRLYFPWFQSVSQEPLRCPIGALLPHGFVLCFIALEVIFLLIYYLGKLLLIISAITLVCSWPRQYGESFTLWYSPRRGTHIVQFAWIRKRRGLGREKYGIVFWISGLSFQLIWWPNILMRWAKVNRNNPNVGSQMPQLNCSTAYKTSRHCTGPEKTRCLGWPQALQWNCVPFFVNHDGKVSAEFNRH